MGGEEGAKVGELEGGEIFVVVGGEVVVVVVVAGLEGGEILVVGGEEGGEVGAGGVPNFLIFSCMRSTGRPTCDGTTTPANTHSPSDLFSV